MYNEIGGLWRIRAVNAFPFHPFKGSATSFSHCCYFMPQSLGKVLAFWKHQAFSVVAYFMLYGFQLMKKFEDTSEDELGSSIDQSRKTKRR